MSGFSDKIVNRYYLQIYHNKHLRIYQPILLIYRHKIKELLIMTINERIFSLLKEQNKTQKDFSKATNISEQTISAWKSRKTDPPANLLSTIADYFNVTLDFFIIGDICKKTLRLNDSSQDKLPFDERNLLNTYRDLNDDGKTQMLDISKEI